MTEEQAWLDEHLDIRVAAEPDFAPFQFANEAGEFLGMADDHLEIIAQRLEVRFECCQAANGNRVPVLTRLI